MGIRIRPAEVEIPDDCPFQNDLLDRKKPAEVLTQLVDGIDGPCVLAIDAPWGAGKTTFLKMWSQHLRNKGFPVVEFNAWETDYAEDPFVALASELEKGLKALDDGSFKERIKDTMEAAKKVTLRSIPGVIRILTAGILDLQPVFEKEAGNLLAAYADNLLRRYKESEKSVNEFQDKLQKMAISLTQSTKHPLMVVIDELDRCRPSYAVALIEVAKHLFEADHVVFVLAVNRTQLAHSIGALYGSEFDAAGYLRRFFDIDFRLPEPNRESFIQEKLNRMRIRGSFRLLKYFFGSSDLSLRQINQVIHRLGSVMASLRDVSDRLHVIVQVALVIRTIDYDRYWRFVHGNITDEELVDAIYDRVGIRHVRFEAFIVMAAREIAGKKINIEYDKRTESPLIDQYQEQTGDRGKGVIECVRTYEQNENSSLNWDGFGFYEAVRRIELLAGNDEPP